MNREELLALCDLYVRRRGLGTGVVAAPPALEIIDSFLHAEISESEKNSLLAYVRASEEDSEDAENLEEFGAAVLEVSDDDGD
ncbi:MAG: hypothetical protein ACKOEM_17900 [Planctomycetia bacterium]